MEQIQCACVEDFHIELYWLGGVKEFGGCGVGDRDGIDLWTTFLLDATMLHVYPLSVVNLCPC